MRRNCAPHALAAGALRRANCTPNLFQLTRRPDTVRASGTEPARRHRKRQLTSGYWLNTGLLLPQLNTRIPTVP